MVGLVVLGATRVIYGAMVSRATNPETFGVIGVLLALTMLLSFILPAGLGSATSRFVAFNRGRRDPAAARGHHRLLSRIGVIAAVALGIAAAAMAWALLDLAADASVQVGLLTLAYSLYTVEKAALYGFGRFGRYVGLEIGAAVVTLGTTVAVLIAGSTWYLLPFILGYATFVLGARLALARDTAGARARLTPGERRHVLGYAGLAAIGTLGAAGFLQATQLLAARFATPAEIGYFAAAITLITPVYLLPRALGLALFPSMAEAHGAGEGAALRRHADVATRGLLALLAPVFIAGTLLAPVLLVLFGGPAYAAGAPVMQLLLTAAFFGTIQVAAVNALSSGSGWDLRVPVAWSLGGCAVGLIAAVSLGSLAGALGVALGYLAGTVVAAAGPIAVVWRRYQLAWGGPMLRAAVLVAAGCVVALTISTIPIMGRSWLTHGLAAGACLIVALILLWRDILAVTTAARAQPEACGG